MQDVVIVGAGGFGREMYQWLTDWIAAGSADRVPCRIKGFLTNQPHDLDGFDLDADVLGDPDDYAVEADDRFVLAIGTIRTRKRLAARLKASGGRFLTVRHPTAVVSPTATLGEGVIVCPFATVSVNVTLGDFVLLNFYASCGHDARVGTHGVLSPYATVNGFGVLEDEVFMGTHATVTARRRIGARASIGANAVALTDVAHDTLLQGLPARTWSIFADGE